MRLLILTQYFPPEIGATQTRLSSITRALVQAGHDVEVVTALPNYPEGRIFDDYRGRPYRREKVDGVTVHRVWVYAAMGAGFRRLVNYLSFSAMAVLGLVRARRPDYLFIESPPLSLAATGICAAKLWRTRSILNVADLWPDSAVELGLLHEGLPLRVTRRLETWSYKHADHVSAVTEGIRDRLRRKGVPESRLHFLPNGVDIDLFHPRPRDPGILAEYGVPAEVPVVLHAGTMGFAQGLHVAIDAMTELRDRGVSLHLVLVGDGSEREVLETRVREHQLDNVTFVPAVSLERVAELWAGADMGYAGLKDVPLFEGARPSKLFPAMASGKPVVYSGAGEAARLIEEAEAGLVVPPEDPKALADAFARLGEDADLATRLGQNGRCYVEANLTWGKLVDDWLTQLSSASGAASQ